ncbi:beta-lactamase family protein [Sulfidibacter corallicola]|uniref:Beta-lactamase family protein n=2 Tax=Sulfidibacter corallicola TaxID=2818388 RepID=A0A8A4TN51_SULCO|nr:beta-lactamase family protein [Sulfidibacter corallicola]
MSGAVLAIIRNGKLAFQTTVGVRDQVSQAPMTSDTIFRIASDGKLIVSFAVHLLREDGAIHFDDPVSYYIPSLANREILVATESVSAEEFVTVPATEEITIRHLLNHCSGIDYGFNNTPIMTDIYQAAGVQDGLAPTEGSIGEMVNDSLSQVPLLFEPGERFNYGLSTDVLGYLVEVVSGQSLQGFLQDRIFDPLEMHDTFFHVPTEKLDRVATIYQPVEGGLQALPDEPFEIFPHLFMSNGLGTNGPQTYFSAGAGLCTTPDDFSRFMAMLLKKGKLLKKSGQCKVKVAKKKTVKRFLNRKKNDVVDLDAGTIAAFNWEGYQFMNGFAIKTNKNASNTPSPKGTISWIGAYNTHYFLDPKNKLGGFIMTGLFPYLQTGYPQNLEELTYAALLDEDEYYGDDDDDDDDD